MGLTLILLGPGQGQDFFVTVIHGVGETQRWWQPKLQSTGWELGSLLVHGDGWVSPESDSGAKILVRYSQSPLKELFFLFWNAVKVGDMKKSGCMVQGLKGSKVNDVHHPGTAAASRDPVWPLHLCSPWPSPTPFGHPDTVTMERRKHSLLQR